MVCGYTNAQIAGKLYISQATVKSHVRNILRKAGARSRWELLRHASGTGDRFSPNDYQRDEDSP